MLERRVLETVWGLVVRAMMGGMLIAGPTALGQDIDPTPEIDSTVHLATGFLPDPLAFDGSVEAVRGVETLSPGCGGFVGEAPSQVFTLESRFGYLRLFATSDADLVLAVRTASGDWICSDDRFGIHPAVEGLFLPGRLEVWVGTNERGVRARYALRITETRSIRPGSGGDTTTDDSLMLARDLGLEVEATEGLFEPIQLRRGFLPDPRFREGTAGGPIDAAAIGGSCRGYVTARPTHLITLLSPFDFMQLFLEFGPDEARELTLVVETPDGRFLCDVGTRALPHVSMESWDEGVYRVWVGTIEEDTTREHRLGISEIRRVRSHVISSGGAVHLAR